MTRNQTDAIARTGAERNVGERMAADAVLREEALRVEFFRIREDSFVVVHSVNEHKDVGSGRNIVLSYIKMYALLQTCLKENLSQK